MRAARLRVGTSDLPPAPSARSWSRDATHRRQGAAGHGSPFRVRTGRFLLQTGYKPRIARFARIGPAWVTVAGLRRPAKGGTGALLPIHHSVRQPERRLEDRDP